MKVLIVYGTRPEAIKLIPVIRELKRRHQKFDVKICSTAQHRELLGQVHSYFKIVPDYDLDLMTHDQTLFDVTTKALTGIRDIVVAEKSDLILVQGDTTTALSAALAGFYLKVPVGHVEAGLRTFCKTAPFPEETNRKLIADLSDYHFVPSETARKNLLSEGIKEKCIYITGNTIVDILNQTLSDLSTPEALLHVIDKLKKIIDPEVVNFEYDTKDNSTKILVTSHRRENFGNGLKNVCTALAEISTTYPDVRIIYCTHPNRNAHQSANKLLNGIPNVVLIPPLDYYTFVWLMKSVDVILTDSGGIQEEALYLNKKVLLIRSCTERLEAVESNHVQIIGVEKESIIAAIDNILRAFSCTENMLRPQNPYGNGDAAKRIADILEVCLCLSKTGSRNEQDNIDPASNNWIWG